MRKLALLLGSLLVVASASAKEVVPAPVVVEEAPVQVIEKEVIVYRDKEVGFRPNGYVDLQYRWYGETEGQEESFDTREDVTEGNGNWNGNNNYSRIQLQGKINMTEKQSLEYRIRNYNSTSTHDNGKDGTDTRLRYFYNHGNLGDSKVNLTSRVHYRDRDDLSGAQEVEYQARFNFAEYMFNNDFIKTTNFVVAPKYKYVWEASNDDDYDNRLGFDIASFHELPYGFSFELNVYADQHFYGKDQETGANSKTDDNFGVDVEAYLYNTTNLYSNGKLNIDFYFEGGFDPYSWNSENVLKREYRTNNFDKKSEPVKVSYEDSKYKLYAWPQIITSYNATDSFKAYVSLGAEYANGYRYGSDAQDWRWQPVAVVGFRTTF